MAVFAFMPAKGAAVLALWCDDTDEWDRLKGYCEAGTLTLDGQNCETQLDAASDRETLFIRFTLLQPFIPPRPMLVFEDIAAAARIGELGWYTFEGALYRAEHLGDGRVELHSIWQLENHHGRTPATLASETMTTLEAAA